MIVAILVVAALQQIPPSLRPCVEAAQTGSYEATVAACKPVQAGRTDLFTAGASDMPPSCQGLPTSAQTLTKAAQGLADQPVMVAGIRRRFDSEVAACAADATAPAKAPPKTKTAQRLWD